MALEPKQRGLVLTGSKGLMDQLDEDFGHGLGADAISFDVRGMHNYPCKRLEEMPRALQPKHPSCAVGPCTMGDSCDYRNRGCAYYDRVRATEHQRVVSTNYAFWISRMRSQLGIGAFDWVVCDEAHSLLEWVVSGLRVSISIKDLMEFNCMVLAPWGNTSIGEWVRWAGKVLEVVEESKTRLRANLLNLTALARVSNFPTWWFRMPNQIDGGLEAAPVDPKAHLEPAVFRGVGKIVLSSATITKPFIHDALNINPDDLAWVEADMPTPVKQRPVYVMPIARLTHRTQPHELKAVYQTADMIIEQRPARKGLVHTVSYTRMKDFVAASRNRAKGLLFWHDAGMFLNNTIEGFSKATEGALVSPSLSTGYDFKADLCRYQIVLKMPFPDSRDEYYQARLKLDPGLGDRTVAQTLVQMYGRALRSADDWAECFILDGQVTWFIRKHAALFPRWFLAAVINWGGLTPPKPMEVPLPNTHK